MSVQFGCGDHREIDRLGSQCSWKDGSRPISHATFNAKIRSVNATEIELIANSMAKIILLCLGPQNVLHAIHSAHSRNGEKMSVDKYYAEILFAQDCLDRKVEPSWTCEENKNKFTKSLSGLIAKKVTDSFSRESGEVSIQFSDIREAAKNADIRLFEWDVPREYEIRLFAYLEESVLVFRLTETIHKMALYKREFSIVDSELINYTSKLEHERHSELRRRTIEDLFKSIEEAKS